MKWSRAKSTKGIAWWVWVLLVLLIMMVGGTALVFLVSPDPFDLLPAKALAEFPVPPAPKAYPDCPNIPTRTHDWRGVTFRYPVGWSVEGDGGLYAKEGRYSIYITKDDLEGIEQSLESILLEEERKSQYVAQAVDALWNLPEGQKLDPKDTEIMSLGAIPETIQRLEFDGSPALMYVRRESALLPKMSDKWEIFIKRDGPDYSIDSPHMFHPYYLDGVDVIFQSERQGMNEAFACTFWTVIKSLKFPSP